MSVAERHAGPVLAPTASWRRDVVVANTELQTTGGHVWPAAKRLGSYLEAMAEPLSLQQAGLRVLELGAGVGWLGTMLALNLPHAGCIAVTEQEADGGLDWLSHNINLNKLQHGAALNASALVSLPCDWRHYERSYAGAGSAPSSALDVRWDLIVGSDLVYNEAGTHMLPLVLQTHLSRCPSARVLYAHTKYRLEAADIEFFEQLRAQGLVWREVCEPSQERATPSPPPLTSVFPEQRIAILEISLDSQPQP